MIRNTLRPVSACLLFLPLLPAFAADGLPGDVNPGIALRRQADLRLDKETVTISPQRIAVEDVFTATGKQKQLVPVVFTLPAMHLQDGDARNGIRELRFAVNGLAIKPARKLTVMLGGRDIAWRIALMGWKEPELIAFLREGVAPEGKPRLPAAWFDKDGRPRFRLRETFGWDQWFAPGRAVTIRHSYVPATTGETSATPSQLVRRAGDAACIDDARLATLRALDSGAGIDWTGVRYRIAGSRGWRPGAQDFTLRVDAGGGFVATCLAGGKALDKRTLQFRANAISMDQAIDLVFARAGGQSP